MAVQMPPILKDSTGQSINTTLSGIDTTLGNTNTNLAGIITALQALSAPSATNVAVSPTGLHYITEDDAQGALAELDAECYALNNSLTQYPNHGTATNVTFTNNQYTITHSGVLTGYFRKTTNATAGYVGIKSSITNAYRYFNSLTSSGEFCQINMVVFSGEVLTYEESEILSSVLQFIPFSAT